MDGDVVVGGAALRRRDRDPAVAVFIGGAGEERDGTEHRPARCSDAFSVQTGERGVRRDQSVAARFVQRDDAGERAGAIRTGAGAAHDLRAADVFRRQRRPDHPAAERIVLRHAVERHQRAARARRRDGAQRDALRRRIGGKAAVAAEQRQARHLLQRVVELRWRCECRRRPEWRRRRPRCRPDRAGAPSRRRFRSPRPERKCHRAQGRLRPEGCNASSWLVRWQTNDDGA